MDSPKTVSAFKYLPQIARQAVIDRLSNKKAAALIAAYELKQARGLFVTIHTLDQRLRGCRGTTSGTCSNLIEETQQNACSAAFDDPRFPPVTMDEMPSLEFEVSILGESEFIEDESELDPDIFGIIISTLDGKKRGLMLPGIPHLDTIEKQIASTRSKVGMTESEPISLQRFRVDKIYEQG